MFLRRLPIAALLVCLAAPPLLAFTVQSGISTYGFWQADREFDKVAAGERLALAGVDLARAMPGEVFAPPEAMAAARKASDDAFVAVAEQYRAWRELTGGDDTVARDLALIADKRGHVGEFRALLDAKDPTAHAAGLAILQPAAGAGLDLVRRLSDTVGDFAIARQLAGLHALLQFGDATFIYIRPGDALLEKGTLGPEMLGFALHGANLKQIYGPALRELLPAAIVAAHDAFENGPDGQFLAKIEAAVRRGQRGELAPELKPKWEETAMARAALTQRLVGQTVADLKRLTEDTDAATRSKLLAHAAILLAVLAASVGLCGLALSNLRSLIGAITTRMRALAEGDKNSPIPLHERSDELGEIARALETFRRAAIRNAELEAASLAQRAEAERTQRDAQAAAEREAEAWMQTATRAFAEGLQRLAGGDLGCELKDKLAEQFERLRGDFNLSVRTLRETLQTVGDAADTVEGRSAEISHSAEVLAAAASRQSEALAETSQSLADIAADVQATAARAGQTRASVGDTRERAERADAVMRKAIAAMEKIETSAAQIARINGVVDEIAFQTNLLALNAGVEAARAGESGRGFAVVAQEVRELALRSASAAKEIGQLVATTGASIGEGVKLVHATGEELRAIGERVTRVDEDVRAIAHAAGEQAKGLGAVTETLSGLDRDTRANAEMVSQLNAAGGDLAAGSQELNALMSRFQIAEARAA